MQYVNFIYIILSVSVWERYLHSDNRLFPVARSALSPDATQQQPDTQPIGIGIAIGDQYCRSPNDVSAADIRQHQPGRL
jgi:hypothetical protein